jgi:hypothetical protein
MTFFRLTTAFGLRLRFVEHVRLANHRLGMCCADIAAG